MTLMHHALLAFFSMALGCCVGSFLNVCIYRIPRGLSLIRPRSHCPRCGVSILARHNVPVLGWLMLGGRCRTCRGPISARYPAVEMAVGALFMAPYLVAVSLTAGDPWERLGSGRLLVVLAGCWFVAGLCTLALGIGSETRWSFRDCREGERRRAAGGGEGPAASVLRSSASCG